MLLKPVISCYLFSNNFDVTLIIFKIWLSSYVFYCPLILMFMTFTSSDFLQSRVFGTSWIGYVPSKLSLSVKIVEVPAAKVSSSLFSK